MSTLPKCHSLRRFAPKLANVVEQCESWNRANPVGTTVDVARDNGTVERTRTRSEAYILSGHSAVVMLEGISGCYLLDRCKRTAA